MTINEFQQQLKDEILRRGNMLVQLEKDKAAQQAAMKMCKDDILTFINNFVWMDKNGSLVTDPELPEIIPAILFEYQVDFITDMWDCIVMGTLPIEQRTEPTNMFLEKSRQM